MAGRGGRNPGAGRPKGSPNKITADLREMILTALDELGGVEYLKGCAINNSGAFLALIAKILPKQIEARVTPEFHSMSQDELKALIEEDLLAIGWMPEPNGRRLTEPHKPVPRRIVGA